MKRVKKHFLKLEIRTGKKQIEEKRQKHKKRKKHILKHKKTGAKKNKLKIEEQNRKEKTI